jgi:hypothetical protein
MKAHTEDRRSARLFRAAFLRALLDKLPSWEAYTRRRGTLRAPGSFGKRKRSENKGDQAMASAIASVLLDACGATS